VRRQGFHENFRLITVVFHGFQVIPRRNLAFVERTILCRCFYLAALCNLTLQSAEPDNWTRTIDVAERLHAERKYTEARTILLGALKDASNHQNRNHRLAYTFNNLGSVAQDQGRYLEAEKHYRRSISYWQEAGERSLADLAKTLNNLASMLDSAGRFAEAEELLRRSEMIQVESLGRDDPEIGVLLLNRGTLYFKQHKYREAEDLYRRARAILEPHRESRELELANIAAGLGSICDKTGRTGEAKSHYAFAQGVWEKQVASGKALPEIYMNLAVLYTILRQGPPAKRMLQEALVVAERDLGHGHPRIADMLLLYARVLRDRGGKAEAAQMEKQAKAIQTSSQQSLARHTVDVSDLMRAERSFKAKK
jgi:tetratricopeptide (TPR) repeat protein